MIAIFLWWRWERARWIYGASSTLSFPTTARYGRIGFVAGPLEVYWKRLSARWISESAERVRNRLIESRRSTW